MTAGQWVAWALWAAYFCLAVMFGRAVVSDFRLGAEREVVLVTAVILAIVLALAAAGLVVLQFTVLT